MKHGSETAYKLMQAFIQLNRQRLQSAPIGGLKPSEWGVLKCITKLDDGQGVMVSELSSLMKVSAPSITQTVNGLVKKGLVDRAADPDDRRAVRMRVTKLGQETLTKAFEEFQEKFDGLVGYLGEDKSLVLTDLLNQVYNYFETN